MRVPVWSVLSWEPVFSPVDDFHKIVGSLVPISTNANLTEACAHRSGQCLWGTSLSGQPIGLAWDWADAVPGAPALVDPMHILSNLHLLDDEGFCLPPEDKIVRLNEAVHQLRWQPRVLEDLEQHMPPPAGLSKQPAFRKPGRSTLGLARGVRTRAVGGM